MRHFQNSVLDFKLPVSTQYVSASLETAWASEAIFFLRIEEVTGGKFVLRARPQISVDGIEWIDEGTVFPNLDAAGQYALRLTHFGGWLRLVATVEGMGVTMEITTNLVLKE